MSETPPAAPVAAMPTYADQILAVAIVAGGQNLVTRHVLSTDQLNTIAGDVVSLAGVVWAVFAANPSKKSPVVWLMDLIRAAPRARQATWNAAIDVAVEALVSRIEAKIDALIHAKAGILAGPIDSIANHEIKSVADTAEKAVTIPQS